MNESEKIDMKVKYNINTTQGKHEMFSNMPCPKCGQCDIEITKKDGSLAFLCNSCIRFFQPTPKWWSKVNFKDALSQEEKRT
jgi:hypothetical protein